MSHRKQTYDPLRCIPSASVLRTTLAETEEQARRLRILLETAERIEKETPNATFVGVAGR